MVRSKPGASASPSPKPILPTRPPSLSSSGRTPSIITPSSPTLTNARVVQVIAAKPDDPTGAEEETVVRPLSPHDVLSGRGGLVNGYVGNVAYRNMVAERRAEYLEARKRDKAEVARSIVRAVLERGGMFLKRHDDPKKGGDGGSDGRGSKWVDIGEARAREKTSQALREGLDVRGKGDGKTTNAVYALAQTAASEAAAAAPTSPPKKRGRPPKKAASSPPPVASVPVYATASPQPPPMPPPHPVHGPGCIAMASFLPLPIAQFLYKSHPAITTPEGYAEATRTDTGKNEMAASLSVWSTSVSAMGADRTYDWLGSLGTIELWRKQVEIWSDGLAFLMERQEAGAAAAAPPSPSPKKKAKVVKHEEDDDEDAPNPSPKRGTRGAAKKGESAVSV